MNKNSKQTENNKYAESETIVLDLEMLTLRYNNLLIEYENAVSNYINYLSQEESTPCGSYIGSSTNIDQTCINQVWKNAGCGSGTFQPGPNPSATLNDIINSAFGFSKQTDYNHRMQCYGNPGNPYIIICVGTAGNLWSRQGLDAPWQEVNDNSGGNLKSVCTGSDGKTIYASTTVNSIWTKTSWDATSWNTLPNTNNCCVYSLAQGQNGTIVGVGTNNVLWSNTSNMFSQGWSQTATPGEYVKDVAIAPDGSIFVVGYNNQIWKKNSYQNLTSQQWVWQGDNTCCVKAITIAPDGTFIGVGMDDQLYTKASYKDLSTAWQGPYSTENGSCCAVSITTIVNPNYNASNYNQSSQPNYNINAQPFVTVNNSAYWGTSGIGQTSSKTLQECQATCSSTNGCTGATYDSGNSTCFLRGGNSSLTASSDTQVAIVPKGQQLLSIIQNINLQLTQINTQIQNKTNSGQPLYTSQTNEGHSETANLISQFLQLTKERNKIDEVLASYELLDEKQTQGSIMINQNYYSFILLLGLVIIIIYVLYNFTGLKAQFTTPPVHTEGQLNRKAYVFVFGIIVIIVAINFLYNRNFFNVFT